MMSWESGIFGCLSGFYRGNDENIDDAMQMVDNMMYENKKEIKKNYPGFARE